MVVFRLTQEEYTRLRDACKSKGGRNLSEYTRSELLAMLQSDSIAGLIQKRFGELEEKLADINVAVAQLTEVVECNATAVSARRRNPITD